MRVPNVPRKRGTDGAVALKANLCSTRLVLASVAKVSSMPGIAERGLALLPARAAQHSSRAAAVEFRPKFSKRACARPFPHPVPLIAGDSSRIPSRTRGPGWTRIPSSLTRGGVRRSGRGGVGDSSSRREAQIRAGTKAARRGGGGGGGGDGGVYIGRRRTLVR